MYAGEFAVNHVVDYCDMVIDRSRSLLDGYTADGESLRTMAHIHCWQVPAPFYKFDLDAGKYYPRLQKHPLAGLERATPRGYAFWMTLYYSCEVAKAIPCPP
jgi:hypothetical protein